MRGADGTQLIKFDDARIVPKFGYYYLKSVRIDNQDKYERHFKHVKEIKIPLPPLDVQNKVVAEIEALEARVSRTTEEKAALKLSISTAIKDSAATVGEGGRLGAVASYSQERVACSNLTADTYVGVDNLLQNMEGKVTSQFVPNSGTAIAYSDGDILLSNIRPYLKKIWLADNDGGSSGDVLVLKVNKETIYPKYLFYQLATDEFFEYEMHHIKGVKMPRADRSSVLNYTIYVPPLATQRKIVAEIEKIESKIVAQNVHLEELAMRKDEILEKYL